jgi:hypothetical protein
MDQVIDSILNDFDAEFGLNSQAGQTASFSQHETPRRSPARSPSSKPSHSSFSQDAQLLAPPRKSPRRGPPADSDLLHPSDARQVQPARPGRISVEEATQIISDMKKQRVQDAEKMQQLQTENAKLVAKLTILEHTDMKVAELGARLEQLLQKYLEAEQIRQQQAAQITELRQELVVLKSRIGGQPAPPRRRSAKQ